jgi:cyclopropane fatty-acyl-phospholipid synthase-like methyltransferase
MSEQDLQVCMKELQTSLKYIEKNQKEYTETNRTDHQELKKIIEDWIEKADEKYAPIWAAQAVKFLIGTMALIVIGAVLQQILK